MFLATIVLFFAAALAVAEPGDLKHPDWHPNGKLLVAEGSCAGSIDLYLVDLESRTLRLLWDGKLTEGYPRWFPDGKRIAFHQIDDKRNSRILVADISPSGDISGIRPVSEGPFDIEPAPSPDGTRIAYTQPGDNGLDLALLDLSSERVTRVWKTEFAENFPAWLPNGDAIIFYARKPDGTQVYQRDLESDQVSSLTEGEGPNMVGNISPDGKRLAFSSERDGDREIYMRNLESGEEKRQTMRAGRDGYPKFSPDGRWLAYHSVIDERFTVIRLLNLRSGELSDFSCQDLPGDR